MHRPKERILLVDDEPQVLVALEDLLSERFLVQAVESAERALEIIQSERDIAVVVTDQRMPAMTGAELLTRLGPANDVQRIMVTGYADLTAVVRAVNEGQLFAYVTKPWNEDDLLLKVSKAAEQFRLTQELTNERRMLHEQTRLLNCILDGVGDGVVVTDSSGEFLVFNPEARRILGAGAERVNLREWAVTYGIFESDQKTPLRAANNPLFRAMEGGVPPLETELFVKNPLLGNMQVSMSATPLRGADDVLLGGIALLEDVTERRLLEAQLLQSQKMEAIGQLAGGVAHDFNNLLSVIQSYGELILSGLPEDPQMRDDMNELLGATQRAAALTNQLLTFSRQQPTKPEHIDLNQLIRNVENMLRRLLGSRIELQCDLAEDVGLVTADTTQVEQILLNLAVNARDAMPNGGVLRIESRDVVLADELGASSTGRFALMSVSDEGTGMSEEVRKRIFDPFFTTKPVGKGTGLGLSTVYGIVRKAGGHIAVESELGRGTRFLVHLPVPPKTFGPPVQGTIPPSSLGNETLLLVEDEEPVRRVAARILRERGYTVLETGTAEEARRLFARHARSIDMVVVDLILPGVRGEDLAAEFVATSPTTRVLYLASALPRSDGGGPPHEPSGHLEKPFSPNALVNAVRNALSVPAA